MRPAGPRAISGALIVAGILIGTLSDREPARLPWRAGGYDVLSADFHVHAFPGDGALAPWTLRDEAERAGIDVFAVTNHNRTFTARFAAWLAIRSGGPMVIHGEEITAKGYHLIAIGVERTIGAGQPAASAIAEVHEQGGVAIAAHPLSSFHGYDDDGTVAALDGTEAAHVAVRERDHEDFVRFFERARRLKPNISPIGSSDFHISPALAICRTFVFVTDRSISGVLDAIRHGRTVALDEHGRLYGDATLVQFVQQEQPVLRSDRHAGWRRLSITMTWLGVLGVILLSSRRRS